MRSWVGKAIIIFLIPAILAGCGSSSSSRKPGNTVAQVVVSGSQTSLSLVPGEVETLSFQAQNSSGGPVTNPNPTITFSSSKPNLVTVFGTVIGGVPVAEVCAGVWDSAFIVCKPATDSAGIPLLGKATIIATSEGVSSAPVPVAIHQVVTSVTVNPVPGCFSNKQTRQLVAHALHDGTDITDQIGSFTWSNSQANVASIDANGIATAQNPGLTGVVATVGTVASPAVNFRTCMPVQIILHVNGDPAGMPTEAVTQAVTNPLTTTTIQADMIDENNVTTASAPVTVVSNNPPVGPVAGTTLTASDAGGAGLVAVCAPPNCGAGLNIPIYSNLFRLTVTGGSAATTVYATTTFAPPSASPTPTIVPIDTSKTPPAAGTAINMPCPTACAVPNSMVFAANGTKAFLGTSQGLASLDATANTVTLLDPFVGKVLAVSPDGSTVIESNAASVPDPTTGTPGIIEPRGDHQRVVVFSGSSSQTFAVQGASAAAFTSDGSKAFISTNNGSGNVYVFSTFATFRTVPLLPLGSTADVTTLASGPFAFFADNGLQVMATCNNVQQTTPNPPTQSTSIQLLQSFKNADAFVAMDSTGVNIETATVTSLTPQVISPTNCAPKVTYSKQFVDFGVGPITARQLLVGSNLGSHIVVLPAGLPQVLAAIAGNPGPAIIPLATGATEALSGSMTQDGDTLWVGVAGTNKVDEINLLTASDVLQIATSFKKSDGTAAPPNLVAVKPK